MTNKIISTESEELSFLDLSEKYHILIPAIQRDYAQGRLTKKATKIRHDFTEELYNYIFSDESHSLDFIYGTTTHDNKYFIPLDGQQRLTTLFLLHLYLEGMALSNDNTNRFRFRFTYETRDSSTRFCSSLTDNRIDLFKEIKKATDKTPKEVIKNENWWFMSWETDPTIAGMLEMLDEIDRRFRNDASAAYQRLFDRGNQPVVFEFLPLEKFHDTDDLYIKMNARGLELTDYEIFKSRLIEDISEQLPDREKELKADLDVRWVDALWKKRKSGDKNIDILFERIFRITIATESSLIGKFTDEQLDMLFEANNRSIVFAHNRYLQCGVSFNRQLLERIMSDIDIICSALDSDCKGIPAEISNIIADSILNGGKLEYRDRLKLHAFLRFTDLFSDSDLFSELDEWMRLIHNLAASRRINNSYEMVSAIRNAENLINDLLAKTNAGDIASVNDWIAESIDFKNIYFPDFQWDEEVIKSRLRKDYKWRELISKAEQHPYLDGQIAITLNLADVIADRLPSPLDTIPDTSVYCRILDLTLPIFTEIGDINSDIIKSHLFVRAMLSAGDYMPADKQNRKNIYNRPNDRDYSWKRLFRIDNNSNTNAIRCLKDIITDKSYDPSDIRKSLSQFISNAKDPSAPEWIKTITGKYGQNLLEASKQGFIAFDNSNVIIYHQSQRNHYHSELKSRYLYELMKSHGHDVEYRSVRSSNEDSGVVWDTKFISHWDNKWYVSGENSATIDFGNITDLLSYLNIDAE